MKPHKFIFIYLLFAIGVMASPDDLKGAFLARNPSIRESIIAFAATSIDREKLGKRNEYYTSCDTWGLLFDLGRKLPVKTKKEIPSFLENGYKKGLEYLDELSKQIPPDGCIFIVELKGDFASFGYLILGPDKTIRSDLIFGEEHKKYDLK